MVGDSAGRPRRNAWLRRAALAQRKASRLDPTVRGLLWSSLAGLLFVVLNTLMRGLALQLDPFQTQFLRYVAGLLVMLPLVLRAGLAAYRPRNIGGQFGRGAVHTFGLCLWFLAVPHIGLADTTAIGFTGPIFIMIGAVLLFHEPMRWERWVAALFGFAGVLLVVAPGLSGGGGWYPLVMLASSPVFAGSCCGGRRRICATRRHWHFSRCWPRCRSGSRRGSSRSNPQY